MIRNYFIVDLHNNHIDFDNIICKIYDWARENLGFIPSKDPNNSFIDLNHLWFFDSLYYDIENQMEGHRFYFKNKNDALLFKLTWGGK